MTRRSVKIARLFGFILFILISAWDVDAMRPHIAAHSWTTLAFVSLFLAAHLSDYFTVGRLVGRLDPLILRHADEIAGSAAEYGRSLPPVDPGQTPALYIFTVVTAIEAQASGAPYPITRQSITVQPEWRESNCSASSTSPTTPVPRRQPRLATDRVPYSGEARAG
jgi:hypothetical protein